MPKFDVMINRTRTIESYVEIEVSAKDEESAITKAEETIAKALEADKLEELDWTENSDEDDFDYEASEQ